MILKKKKRTNARSPRGVTSLMHLMNFELHKMKKYYYERTCNRTMPEENGGGWDLRSETAVISLSVAATGEVTVGRVLVSTVPSGALWSVSHPFMDIEHSRNLCFTQKLSS